MRVRTFRSCSWQSVLACVKVTWENKWEGWQHCGLLWSDRFSDESSGWVCADLKRVTNLLMLVCESQSRLSVVVGLRLQPIFDGSTTRRGAWSHGLQRRPAKIRDLPLGEMLVSREVLLSEVVVDLIAGLTVSQFGITVRVNSREILWLSHVLRVSKQVARRKIWISLEIGWRSRIE